LIGLAYALAMNTLQNAYLAGVLAAIKQAAIEPSTASEPAGSFAQTGASEIPPLGPQGATDEKRPADTYKNPAKNSPVSLL
jgi:hypothetical protein